MPKLCDRCRVSGCCLDYLGTACKTARKRECPDVLLSRAEYISEMNIDQMAKKLPLMLHDLVRCFAPDETTVNYPPLIKVGACNCPVVQTPF